MLKTETKDVPPQPSRTDTFIIEIVCDLCGHRRMCRNGTRSLPDEIEWKERPMERTSVQLQDGEGAYLGRDGGMWTETIFHVCPSCFRGKLMPWFLSQGACPTIKKVDF
jgi:hypothetical protein